MEETFFELVQTLQLAHGGISFTRSYKEIEKAWLSFNGMLIQEKLDTWDKCRILDNAMANATGNEKYRPEY